MNIDRVARARFIALFILALSVVSPVMAANSDRLHCIPELHAGQKFIYRVRYKTQKVTRSQSNIATPRVPEEVDNDTERYVSVEIKKVEIKKVQGPDSKVRVMMRTQLLPTDGTSRPADDGVVEFTLMEDGRAEALKGFDVLSVDEQAVWRQWIAQFALGWTFPDKGMKVGEKWKREEPVVGAALAKLVWEKQFEYVRKEACPASSDSDATSNGGGAAKGAGQCAVVISTSTMKQQGSHDEATPDDYKLHQLKTSGAAKGKTDVLTFISLKTGFLERANEDSAQTMDVVVAKADDSNKVHLNVAATSHAEVTLVQ